MDTFETSYSDVKASEPYISVDDTTILVCVGIITKGLFGAICETECIDYLAAIKSSNANIMTSEFDNAIGEIGETADSIVNDIVFSRVEGSMWQPSGYHIERGCETSLLLCIQTHQVHPTIAMVAQGAASRKDASSSERVAQPTTSIITIID